MNLVPGIANCPAWMRVLYVLWEARRTRRRYKTFLTKEVVYHAKPKKLYNICSCEQFDRRD